MSRIIAGSRRGRRLTMPSSGLTRPTTDRVREALFSALTSWAGASGESAEQSLHGLSFCDLYTGSGAVGLEAASRGAAPVLLVEADKRTASITTRNARDLDLRVQVRSMKVEQLLAEEPAEGFDIVFADPPYDVSAQAVEGVLSRLLAGGWLAAGGMVVVERSRRGPDLGWPDGIGESWSRRYGETVLHFGVSAEPAP